MLQAPVSYQGGKTRLATKIVDILLQHNAGHYYDLCCGSGAISIELINRGVSPANITMNDAGPWGIFWSEIGQQKFDIDKLRYLISSLPSNIEDYRNYFCNLSKQDANIDTTCVFLLLQAASFGSKPIWIENNRWKNCSFRYLWKPTPTSNRRSTVNPMMPMPQTLLSRVELLLSKMAGVNGRYDNANNIAIAGGSIVYIDSPYEDSTRYGHDIDIKALVSRLNCPLFISETKPLSDNAILLSSSSSRTKGGINGKKTKKANDEWLSCFNVSEPIRLSTITT